MHTNHKSETDQQLLARLRTDDHQAFNELFHRYSKLLTFFVQKRIDDDQLAKDIVHDTFLKIWKKRFTLETTYFKTYLFTIAKNEILLHFEKKQKSEKLIDHLKQTGSFLSPAADQNLRVKEMAARIDLEITALPQKYRTAFHLRRTNELSIAECAQQLNITEVNFRMIFSRSLKMLSGLLNH